jgi:replicative DNA helicase
MASPPLCPKYQATRAALAFVTSKETAEPVVRTTITGSRTSVAIHAAMRRLVARTKVHLVIIDHLHEMRGVGRSEKHMEDLRRWTSDIKLMGGELGFPVILLVQLNRGPENESRKPTMRDIRECGDIEQIADIILFLHSKEEMATASDKKPFIEVQLLIAKQRDGARFLEIPLYFHGPHLKFVQAEQENAECKAQGK